MKKITKFMDRVTDWFSWIGIAALVAMMLLISADVLLRYLFNNPITGSYEIIMVLEGIAVFTAFSYTQKTNSHISVTMLIRLFPMKLRILCVVLGAALSAMMGTILTIAFWRQAVKALKVLTVTTTLTLKLYPIYFICCALMGFFALTLILYFVKSVYALFNQETAEELMSTWV
jgi:TRAP-type C4-dicarboxylate transport system permease small subunit